MMYTLNFFQVINRNVGVDGKSGNKLRTFALMKKEYKFEDYLMADLSRKKATNLAQLRTSAHNLAIEMDRYARPAVLSCERKCKMCDLDEVEDEVHFVNRCTAYEEDRRELFGNVAGPQQEASDTYFCVVNAKGRKRGTGSHRKVYIQKFSTSQMNPLRQSCLISVY